MPTSLLVKDQMLLWAAYESAMWGVVCSQCGMVTTIDEYGKENCINPDCVCNNTRKIYPELPLTSHVVLKNTILLGVTFLLMLGLIVGPMVWMYSDSRSMSQMDGQLQQKITETQTNRLTSFIPSTRVTQ